MSDGDHVVVSASNNAPGPANPEDPITITESGWYTFQHHFYDSGNGFRVECASCHDPHGVPAKGGGPFFNKTFMRVSNDGSDLCLTCHIK